MRYAIIQDNVVINVILWDGEEPYAPEEGCLVYESPDEVSIGWSWDDEQWIAPEPPIVEVPPEETSEVTDAKQHALLELTALGISEATARTIVGLSPIEQQE